MKLFTGISENYIELQMYEDALENAEKALKIKWHFKKA